jgi:hypothetical protein
MMGTAASRLLLGAASTVLLAAMPQAVAAQFVNCPQADGGRRCQVSTPNSALVVFAQDGRGPVLQVESWIVDGMEQIGIEAIRVRDDGTGSFPEFDLVGFETFPPSDQVFFVLEDGDLVLSSIFTLRENEEDTTLDFDITLRLLNGSATGRVFLVSDPNLDGDLDDDSVASNESGLPVIQIGGRVESTLTLEQGAAPTGVDVGLASEFAPLLSNQLVTLDGTESQLGPADLGSVLVWQATIGSEDLQFRVRRTLTVPEPRLAQCQAVALLVLWALARTEKSKDQRPSQVPWRVRMIVKL